jgi:hypothetical protein
LQGTAGVKVAATVNGTTVGSFVAAHHDGISISCLSTFGSLSTNCDDVTFGGGSFAGRLQTQTVTVPIGTPVAIFLEIEVLTSAQAQGASATSTFSNSLDLAVGRDLFDLPVGYTVNSATSLITDNQFTPQIAAVPEPDAVVLLGLGLAMMVGTLRPRRWTVCGLIRRRLKPPELAPHEQPTRRINEMWGTSSPRWIARVAPCFGLRS